MGRWAPLLLCLSLVAGAAPAAAQAVLAAAPAAPATAAVTGVPHAFTLAAGGPGTLRVVKTALRQPEFLFPAYVPVGEVFRAPVAPAGGQVTLDFTFWDPGRYEVRLEEPGRPAAVAAVQVSPTGRRYASMAGLAALLAALGLLAGYVSYTLPRPWAAAALALALLLPAAGTLPRAARAAAVSGSLRAYETATVAFPLPGGLQGVELRLRHAEDDLDLLRARFRAETAVTFSYRFPEGAPYEALATATPVGGGAPVTLRELLLVAPVQPSTWELVRGWLVGVGFFLAGGAAGLYLGRRRSAAPGQEVAP